MEKCKHKYLSQWSLSSLDIILACSIDQWSLILTSSFYLWYFYIWGIGGQLNQPFYQQIFVCFRLKLLFTYKYFDIIGFIGKQYYKGLKQSIFYYTLIKGPLEIVANYIPTNDMIFLKVKNYWTVNITFPSLPSRLQTYNQTS